MKVIAIIICLLMFSNYVNGQSVFTIEGKVVDDLSKPLPAVIIEATSRGEHFYAVSGNEGGFTITIENGTNPGFPVNLVFKLIGFKAFDTSITLTVPATILKNVSLIPNNTTLSEVIVKQKAIVQKGDTTVFNVASFKNRLDNNIEDVLKKMPGFDVDLEGNIKYNGKAIENILIEGDALTKNYKQISKNIGPDMLDKLEVVDNYNPNPLLKNITKSDGQVINLTLKNRNKLSRFGMAKAGAGIDNKYSLAGNMFALNKWLKSMSIVSLNNIGESPYGEISSSGDQEGPVKEYEFDPSLLPNFVLEDRLFYKPMFSNAQNTLFNNSKLFVFNNN
ncbi:MAG: hypothetical protein EOP55_23820, partial [Sphingobacteriales bacterium]